MILWLFFLNVLFFVGSENIIFYNNSYNEENRIILELVFRNIKKNEINDYKKNSELNIVEYDLSISNGDNYDNIDIHNRVYDPSLKNLLEFIFKVIPKKYGEFLEKFIDKNLGSRFKKILFVDVEEENKNSIKTDSEFIGDNSIDIVNCSFMNIRHFDQLIFSEDFFLNQLIQGILAMQLDYICPSHRSVIRISYYNKRTSFLQKYTERSKLISLDINTTSKSGTIYNVSLNKLYSGMYINFRLKFRF